MKYLALLISLYCTLLAILPCQDRADIAAEVSHVIIQKAHATSERCSQETCPPFCNCCCCSSARQVSAKAVLTVFTKPIVSTYPGITAPGTLSQTISVWQPPQIS
ncbi:DUF6660 family protein [Pedobacter mucosus]|uniref:DUF6660 family protein n=1 Tax=Pedobacter mucosus TaxID=2895286 RepID=UPI001EE4C649|nr:DUF6660 family protein [Pedobacter mucosus]UKT65988.1 hypothetical protein LOK61_09390 [Pedobacter mucosus]